jgi:hypothetical protein
VQVNLSAATGDMGILANHVPSIEALRPGVVEVIESAGSSKKWFGERRPHSQFRAALLKLDAILSFWRLCNGTP